MKLVIDIPEDAYNYIKANGARIPYYKLTDAIKNGTPLPKGRMIILPEDAVKREQVPLSFSCQKWVSEVGLSNATIRIIEADTESADWLPQYEGKWVEESEENCKDCKWRKDSDEVFRRGVSMEDLCASCHVRDN